MATAAIATMLLGAWRAAAKEARPETGPPPTAASTAETPPDATQGTKGNIGPGSAESSGYFGGTDATTYGGSPEIPPPPRSDVEPMTPVR